MERLDANYWTLFKVMVALAIAIPLGLFALAITVGVVGTVLRLAFVAFKLACIAFLAVGAFKIGKRIFGSPSKPKMPPVRDLPQADPYYEAAMRELDTELRQPAR